MYATRTRTNRAITSTHWNGTSWSNGAPTVVKDAYIDSNLTTLNGSFSCRDLIITGTGILTIAAESYVKVLRDIIQDPTTKIILKDKGGLMILNKNANVESVKIRVEKTFPNMQRLDYEFISSPIPGIPIKNISPETQDSRFYTYNEGTNSYVSLNPYITLTQKGEGYMIRVPAMFPVSLNDFNIILENSESESIFHGNILTALSKIASGYNIIGNPYLAKICQKIFYTINEHIIEQKIHIWKKTNAAQGSSYYFSNAFTNNIASDKDFDICLGFLIIKKSSMPPYEITFTPEMMLITEDFSPPDRLYINIKQNNIFHPIGGFCYDVKKFPIPFNDIISGGAISIIDNDFKIICRKDSFSVTDVINIRVFFEISSSYTITIREMTGLFGSLENIYLVDEHLQLTHNLKNSDYVFTSDAGEYLNRFKIKFQL